VNQWTGLKLPDSYYAVLLLSFNLLNLGLFGIGLKPAVGVNFTLTGLNSVNRVELTTTKNSTLVDSSHFETSGNQSSPNGGQRRPSAFARQQHNSPALIWAATSTREAYSDRGRASYCGLVRMVQCFYGLAIYLRAIYLRPYTLNSESDRYCLSNLVFSVYRQSK